MTTAVLDATGTFAASSLLTTAEQSASDRLADALKTELQAEGQAAAIGAAFVGAMVGGEAAVGALAGGAGVAAAAAAGVAAGQAAATATTAAIASGPLMPIAIAAFALPEILVAAWGASAGAGCCGASPAAVAGLGSDFPMMPKETKAQALARAIEYAKQKNADNSCSGNGTWPSYPTPARGSFEEYAHAIIRGAVDEAALFKCWPLAKVNFTKLLATAIDSWNAAHEGPTTKIGVMIGYGVALNPLTYALGQAVPADGTMTMPTGQTRGFTEQTVPTWGGMPTKVITLQVNTGPVMRAPVHLRSIRLGPAPKPAAKPAPVVAAAHVVAKHAHFFMLGASGAVIGALVGGPVGLLVGAAAGAGAARWLAR